jgi:predicted TIM-barrel enzyme
MVMPDQYKLAIASGISIENAEVYLPYIDHFLVASSILDKNDEKLFDEEKLKMLCERIHLYETK